MVALYPRVSYDGFYDSGIHMCSLQWQEVHCNAIQCQSEKNSLKIPLLYIFINRWGNMQGKIMHIVRVVIDGSTLCKTERHLPGVCKYARRKKTLPVPVLVLFGFVNITHPEGSSDLTIQNIIERVFKKQHKNHPTKKRKVSKQKIGCLLITSVAQVWIVTVLHWFIWFTNECK